MIASEKRPVTLFCNIPFCLRRCTFCNREVIEGWNSERMHTYMEALVREVDANAEQFTDCRVLAVRLGGGTASMAHGEDVVRLLKLIRSRFMLRDDALVSMRSSISNFSGASMPLFKRAGIGRYDLEIMSLDPVAFPRYNKVDALGDFPVVCDYFLRTYANDNLGLILMWGLDEPASPSFRRSINAAINTHAVHIILQPCMGKDVLAPELMSAQYMQAQELLGSAGFIEYTPQHFAKPGFEDAAFMRHSRQSEQAGAQRRKQHCVHSGEQQSEQQRKQHCAHSGKQQSEQQRKQQAGQHCKQQREQLGFGLGAQTVFDGVVSTNTSDIELYLAHSDDYTRITAAVEPAA